MISLCRESLLRWASFTYTRKGTILFAVKLSVSACIAQLANIILPSCRPVEWH